MILRGNNKRLVSYLTNRTGAASVKGQVVTQTGDTYDESYVAATHGNTAHTDGVVLVAGIPDGGRVPVATHGLAEALFDAAQTPTHGWWATLASATAGRAARITSGSGTGLGAILESAAAGALADVDVQPSVGRDVDMGGA
jgi:hypothetical protein